MRLKTQKSIRKSNRRNDKFLKGFLAAPEHPPLHLPEQASYTFKHSGNSGDIIYALPAMYALAKHGDVNLYLHLNQSAHYDKSFRHPLGDVTLNDNMFRRLLPLLLAQPRIKICAPYAEQPIDYNLDIIRSYPFTQTNGNIARWYFLAFAVNADLGQPWLQVQADPRFSDCIVIARSQRYHSPGIDYSFLNQYDKLIFVGLEDEFKAMQVMLPKIDYHPVDDFLQLAQVIAGCKFFIGNQSFPFALAEALKVKRLLEVCFHCPNVIVEGGNGFDFCYQPQFEFLVAELNRKHALS
jgi:hypothetical protein